jgi:DNA-binding NarL/FixJ family response regulator
MALVTPAVIDVTHHNAVIEAGLRRILASWPEFEVRGGAHAGGPATQSSDPDVVVLDHDNGISWAKRHPLQSRTNVLVVSMVGQESDIRSALAAGVRGYVLIDCSADEIVNAARAVAAGRRHLCTAATLRMADSLAQPVLTSRETEVLALVFRGNNNKEVARSLGISVGTVKSHMRGLLTKLGARCRTEALWVASQRGLIDRSADAGSDGSAASMRQAPAAGRRVPRAISDPSRSFASAGTLQTLPA